MKKIALIVLCLLVVGCATTGTSNVATAPDTKVAAEAEKKPEAPKVSAEKIGEILFDAALGFLTNGWALP